MKMLFKALGYFSLLILVVDHLFSFVIVNRKNSDRRPDPIGKNTWIIGLIASSQSGTRRPKYLRAGRLLDRLVTF